MDSDYIAMQLRPIMALKDANISESLGMNQKPNMIKPMNNDARLAADEITSALG